MRYETAHATLLGDRRVNQDRCLVVEAPDAVLLALADGMGGHPQGETAAQILMDTARKTFHTSRKPIAKPRVFLSGALDMAHHRIQEYGLRQTPPIEPRTTGVLCLIQEQNAYWAHIGDSRLYMMRDGVIACRTDDHSYVEHLRQQGILSSSQVRTHRYRNYVTRCLGGLNNHPVAELSGPFSLSEGDVVLLCSDGLWGPLPDRSLVRSLSAPNRPLVSTLSRLAEQAAHDSRPESDNVTLVGLRWLHGGLDLEPADISLSLTDNALRNRNGKIPGAQVQQAIDDLRRLLDDNDFEE